MKFYLKLMLLLPPLRLAMLLDVLRKPDGSEPYEVKQEPLDTTFIDLMNQVRWAMSYGEIPFDPNTPKYSQFTIPLLFRREAAVTIRRRTLGWWASFTVEEKEKWKPGHTARYFFSVDGEFAMTITSADGDQGSLMPRSTLEVLLEQEMWYTGLSKLLNQASPS